MMDGVGMVGTQLEQQVPVQPGGIWSVIWKRGHDGQVTRRLAGKPITIVEEARTDRHGDRQAIRGNCGPITVSDDG